MDCVCRLFFVSILSWCYLIITILPGTDAEESSGQSKNNDQPYYSAPHAVGSFGAGDPVYGIYRFKENLYLVRDSTTHVEVYDVHLRNDWKGKLMVDGMKGPYDLVGSDYSRTLFITDWFDSANITTVSTKSQNQVGRFSFNEDFTVVGLAATKQPSDSDVILTCSQTMKIKEYTKFGELKREVQIPSSITQPRHAIKLSSGEGYVVCHGYGADPEQHRVCLLGNTGTIKDCFGSMAGNGKEHIDVCSRVAEDDNQDILVADRNNKRIILLSNTNGKLKFKDELVTERDGLKGPTRILNDGPLLYVVDNLIDENGLAVSGKVLVFRMMDGRPNF